MSKHKVNSHADLHRSLDRWSKFTYYNHDSLKDFIGHDLHNGLHSIDLGSAPLDFVVKGVKGSPLVICLDGNSPRSEDRRPPFFSGFGIMPTTIEISHVSVSDPSLSLSSDLTLAWYAGSSDIDLQSLLPQVFNHIIDQLEPTSIFFFGGSGGGFASMIYASLIPDSVALVWNPQTDLTKYNPAHVLKYAKDAFSFDGTIQEVTKKLQESTLCELQCEVNRITSSRIIYLQNLSDGHVLSHLGPLLDKMQVPRISSKFSGMIAENFYLHLENWGSGHVPPPKNALTAILEGFLPFGLSIFENDGHYINDILNNHLTKNQIQNSLPLAKETS